MLKIRDIIAVAKVGGELLAILLFGNIGIIATVLSVIFAK